MTGISQKGTATDALIVNANPFFVQKLDFNFNLEQALKSLDEITAKYPLGYERRQLSLVSKELNNPTVEDGIGSLFESDSQKWLARESDYRYFNPEFKSTYFYEIYKRLQDHTNGKIGRARLMCLPPKACYSIHRDPTMRIHLPLLSNSQALFIFASGEILNLSATGDVYRIDTRRPHTAMNGGLEMRIHFVLSEIEDEIV